MKKIDKEFVLSNSNLNQFGFRLLTSGYQLAEFAKNPIGYYKGRDNGVVVRWTDLAIKGDDIVGKPIINTSNPRGQEIADAIENGFLNCAAVGHLVILEKSDDASLMQPFQTGPTVTKWYNRECSLTDIPVEGNGLSLYDKNGNVMALADFFPKNKTTKANAVALSDSVPRSNKEELQRRSEIVEQSKQFSVESLLDNAKAENTINIETYVFLKSQYQNRPIELKELLSAFSNDRMQFLLQLSWHDLDINGMLPELKAKNVEAFKIKFKKQFGRDWKE